MAREELRELRELPKCESHRLLDFERVEILTLESFPPQFILAVSGTNHNRTPSLALELGAHATGGRPRKTRPVACLGDGGYTDASAISQTVVSATPRRCRR